MRILHLLEATHGGTRRHVLDLLPALQREGMQNDLIYSPLRNPAFTDDAAWLAAQGCGVEPLPMARTWDARVDVPALWHLSRVLRQERYDVVHCHSTKAGVLGRLARVINGSAHGALVYTPHCLAFATTLPPRQRRAARYLEKLLAPWTAHFVAVSRHEERIIRGARLAPKERIALIYNGVDMAGLDALWQEAPSPRDDSSAGVIGCFGRLTRQKNQLALLHALAEVLRQQAEARLILVGGGEDEPALRRAAQRLHLSRHVVWTGQLPEARGWYRWCDVVAQPSRWEGCPYSTLEAMAARRVVVASRVGGVEEWLEGMDGESDSGLLYHLDEPEKLAGLLNRVLADNDLRREMGERARQRVANHFSLPVMMKKTRDVYEGVTPR